MTKVAASGNMLLPLAGAISGSITPFHFITTSPVLFDGFEYAEKAGLVAAKSWVEQERKASLQAD